MWHKQNVWMSHIFKASACACKYVSNSSSVKVFHCDGFCYPLLVWEEYFKSGNHTWENKCYSPRTLFGPENSFLGLWRRLGALFTQKRHDPPVCVHETSRKWVSDRCRPDFLYSGVTDGDRANTFWGTPSPFWAKNRSQRVKERLEMFIFPRIDYSRSEPCPIWTLNSKNWLQEVKFSPMNGIWSRPRTHDFWLSVTQCHHRRNRLPRNGSPCT